MPAATGQVAQDRHLVHQVRAEQAQVPMLGVLVADAGLQHERVERKHASVVGDDQGRT